MTTATVPAQCQIICQKSAVTLSWTPTSPPILDLLEQAAKQPAYACRYGHCHTCATDIISGTVAHPPDIPAPNPGQLLPCCAVPLSQQLVINV